MAGLALQFSFAWLTLSTAQGCRVFATLGDIFTGLLGFVDAGSLFVFGIPSETGRVQSPLLRTFAFGTLPSIIFFSALMSVLYHFGLMQRVVRVAALVMQKTLNVSGAESLSVAANIFLGQVGGPAGRCDRTSTR